MIGAIAEKEFRDYLTSRRFLIFFGFLLVVMVLALIQVKLNIEVISLGGMSSGESTRKVYEVMFGVTSNLQFVGAIFALALGFDAITREREDRTLKVLMSHPVFRDQVILGKLLGGAITLAFAVLVTGLVVTGMLVWAGVTIDSYTRLITYFLFAYLYLFLFFTMAVAFSAYAKKSGNALMYSLVMFLIFIVVIMTVAPVVARVIVGPQPKMPPELQAMSQKIHSSKNVTLAELNKYEKLMEEYENKTMEWGRRYWKTEYYITMLSPMNDFEVISDYVLDPYKESSESYFIPHSPTEEAPKYSLSESLSFAKKEIITLFAYIILWFVLAYLGFVRAEIR
ncbi:ABC transporter permease [Thermococcus prieurii]